MEVFKLGYTNFKTVFQANSTWSAYHEVTSSDTVIAYSGNRNYLYKTEVSPDDYADWQSNFSGSVEITEESEAKAMILGLGFVPDSPIEPDGKPVFVPAPFTDGLYMFISSQGDDLTGSVISRGEGALLRITYAGTPGEADTKEAVITFYETVEMHDGHSSWFPAMWGVDDSSTKWGHEDDKQSVLVRVPATSVTPNGSNEGNCNLAAAQQLTPWDSGTEYDPGDLVTHNGVNYYCHTTNTNQSPPNAAYWINMVNVIVPAAGDGAYDVDTSEAIAVPLEGSGYWDYDQWSDTLTPSSSPGSADYMLFDFAMDDIHLVKNMLCIDNTGSWELDAYKVEPILARWKFVLQSTRVDAEDRGAASIAGRFTCFREDTT